MTVYLLHFEEPIAGKRHYLGACKDGNLLNRIRRHQTGHGASLTRRAGDAGIGFYVANVYPDASFETERDMKRKGKLASRCFICLAPFDPPFVDAPYHHPIRSKVPAVSEAGPWDGLNWVG